MGTFNNVPIALATLGAGKILILSRLKYGLLRHHRMNDAWNPYREDKTISEYLELF